MNDADRLKLLFGPYPPPKVGRGETLYCHARGEDVRCGGLSERPIGPWPRVLKTGAHALIVTDELARAVRSESEIAVCHWWGVTPVTVWSWRKALGVGRTDPEGTKRLYREYQPEKITETAYARMAATARTPEARERMAALKRGKPMHTNTAKALARVIRRRRTKAWKANLSRSIRAVAATHPEKWRDRPQPKAYVWTPPLDRKLGATTDAELSRRLGVGKWVIHYRRRKLGLPPNRHWTSTRFRRRPPRDTGDTHAQD